MRKVSLVIIGAGPAGLAAAAEARRRGVPDVLVLERNDRVGGILNQCIHDGFGVERFSEALTGPEYVARFRREACAPGVEILCSAMVTAITPERRVTFVARGGQQTVQAGAVLLATGCRERTRGAIGVAGTRPAGVYTAGVVQHLVNLQNRSVGRRAVILGSGDIGLIMARRLTLEGVEVVEVLEKLPYCSGLQRNVRQCLQDFNIPLRLSTTVTELRGRAHLTGVVASAVDASGRPVPGSEREIACDALILSVGLIPENELARACGVRMDPVTGGALVDGALMTSVPGVFACGNCLHVHDLVDFVSAEAEYAAASAAAYLRGAAYAGPQLPVTAGEGVRYVLPRSVVPGRAATLSLRVKEPGGAGRVCARTEAGAELAARRLARLSPAEMIRLPLKTGADAPLTVALEQRQAAAQPAQEGGLVCTVCPNGCALTVRPDGAGGWSVEGRALPARAGVRRGGDDRARAHADHQHPRHGRRAADGIAAQLRTAAARAAARGGAAAQRAVPCRARGAGPARGAGRHMVRRDGRRPPKGGRRAGERGSRDPAAARRSR